MRIKCTDWYQLLKFLFSTADAVCEALQYVPNNCTNEVVEQLTRLAKGNYYLLRCCVCTERGISILLDKLLSRRN